MQFKVPQFLEIEDKIFGPFTFKQFVYLVGGGGVCFMFFKLLGLVWGFIPIAAVAAFSLALTFYRPNNKPFINMVEAGFKYAFKDKLYIWEKREVLREKPAPRMMSGQGLDPRAEKLGGSKLRDLAWSLDILDLQKESR